MSSSGMTLLAALMLLEALLSWRFNKFYFTLGLPLFRTESSCDAAANAIPSAIELAACMPSSTLQELVFQQIDSTRFAFRERVWGNFFRLSYTPIMHGLLSFDRATGRVRVDGLANWFPLAFSSFFVIGIPKQDAFPFEAFLVGLCLFIYAIQFYRFRTVATLAASSWSGHEGHPYTG